MTLARKIYKLMEIGKEYRHEAQAVPQELAEIRQPLHHPRRL